jgi:hypothetical protein
MKVNSALRYSIAILLGAALFAAPQAATAAPVKDKLTVTVTGPPADLHAVLKAGDGCPGFALGLDGTNSKTSTETFTKNGVVVRTFQSGIGYRLTYTNLDTKKKVTFPAKFLTEETIFHRNGTRTVTNTGDFGLVMFPTDIPAGPSTTQYTGTLVYTVHTIATPNGPLDIFTIIETQATTIDVCAQLARK